MRRPCRSQVACGLALLWLSVGEAKSGQSILPLYCRAIDQLPLQMNSAQAQQVPTAENTSLQPFFDQANNPVNVALRESSRKLKIRGVG